MLLREHKDALGTLVSLENGKIKAEGDGEVQEMIDIADFAVGQSRMLYGKTMPSERPQHRMLEQWHPLGVVGVITAFNFPVAVWAWNAMLAAVCGNADRLEAVAEDAARRAGGAVAREPRRRSDGAAADLRARGVRQRARARAGRRSARRAGVVHRLVGGRPRGRAARWPGASARRCSSAPATTRSSSREDADLDLVVPAVLFGAVGTAGQRCTTTRRLIVHRVARTTRSSRGSRPPTRRCGSATRSTRRR